MLFHRQSLTHMAQSMRIINNAGIIQPFVRFAELELSAIERVLNVNLYGVIYMT